MDNHPIESDRDKFLRRRLALELARLDELEEAFLAKATGGDVAAGSLPVKLYERRAALRGLNPPVGHMVSVVHEPPAKLTLHQVQARA